MSNTGVPVSQAELGDDDRSMFADIMGDQDGSEGQGEQSHEPEGEELEGEGEQEGQGEHQGDEGERERDERGRFAARQEQARGDQQRNETQAERGLRGELRGERDKRQEAERIAAERERQLADLNRSIEDRVRQAVETAMRSAQPQPQAQQPAQQPVRVDDPMPDRWLDPDAYDAWKDRQFDRRMMERENAQEARRVEWSLASAAEKYGDEFKQAHAAAERGTNDPVTRAAMTRVLGSANPGEALVSWFRQQRAMAEIGSDPNAYRERLMQEQRDKLMQDPEFRRQVMETLRQEAQTGNGGGPRTTTQMPPSLNGARGSGSQRAAPGDDDNSDRGIFNSIMSGR